MLFSETVCLSPHVLRRKQSAGSWLIERSVVSESDPSSPPISFRERDSEGNEGLVAVSSVIIPIGGEAPTTGKQCLVSETKPKQSIVSAH